MSVIKTYSLEFLSFMGRYANVLIVNNLIPCMFGAGLAIMFFSSRFEIPIPPFWVIVFVVFMAAAASTFVRFILGLVFSSDSSYSDCLMKMEEVE